ncbi:MAG TPA: hypothetical protein V6C81_31980 [Planktothrix sp.]
MKIFLKQMETLRRLWRKPLTRTQAADLIDKFAEMKWTYSDEFDMAFNGLVPKDDPLLQAVANEFLLIQARYEKTAQKYNGALSGEDRTRLRNLSVKLRATENL